MSTDCDFDLKNPSDLAIHLTEQLQQQKHIFKCLRCSYTAKAIKNLREHESGQHNKYEENIDYTKERGTINPFKCMKCDYDTNATAHIARHLFTIHLSAVINRMKKAVPAKQVKRAGPKATKGRAVPKRYTRMEMVNIFRLK